MEMPEETFTDQPQVSGASARVEGGASQLSAAKRALLEHWRKGGVQESGIPRRSHGGPAPLSFAQQRLWFLEQLMPGNLAYTLPTVIRLRGSLDVIALEKSFNEIVRRHEILRTAFFAREGIPWQHPQPPFHLSLASTNLRVLSEAERRQRVIELARAEAEQPFDLEAGRLLRVKLLEVDEADYILLLTVHHIASDGWSNAILFQELSTFYSSFALQHTPAGLPELPIQYADFADWQRQQLQGEKVSRLHTYWSQQLAHMARCELPADYPRPALLDMRGAEENLLFPPQLTEGIKALSRREGTTLSMTILAAFQLLLARHTGQTDIALGVPSAHRDRIETESLIGLFLNTLVLRTDLSGATTFQELLQRVRLVATAAYAHQDLPFEKLLEELHLERELNRNPLFDIMFNAVNIPRTEQVFALPGVTWEFLEAQELLAKFPFTLYAYEQQDQLKLQVVYQTKLFTPEHIRTFLAQLNFLLEQIVSAPDAPLSTYSLVTPHTAGILPNPGIKLEVPDFLPCTVDILFWARQTPEQVAVQQGKQNWTYAQLARDSQLCAEKLCASGLQPGDVVALDGMRSYGLIVGMIGVLLSGGVLLTLDRHLPIARRLYMLEQARARFLLSLTSSHPVEPEFETFPFFQRIFLDALLGQIRHMHPASANQEDSETQVPLSHYPVGDSPAYIFFTSGTTGMPKGILGIHRSLSHFLHWQRTQFMIGSQDRHAQLTGLAFDVVLRDIFLPLTSGATLCLPDEGIDSVSPEVLPWLAREAITVVHLVPSLARAWLSVPAIARSVPSLRLTFFAGEPLTDTLVHQWRTAISPRGQIINLYGPTETTLARCFYTVPAQSSPGPQPVGQAIPQAQALVLTPDRRLCGVYEPGEVAIRTPFRTLGYLQKGTNGEQFILNPFNAEDSSDLLYLTGDRGYYRLDGLLELRGRLDHQIKLHGIRIEPGEIEAVLEQHPGVQAVSVIAQSQDAQEKRLLAYLLLASKEQCDPNDLRAFLRAQLPEYMLPAEFIIVEQFPLTPNGKVDRAALGKQRGIPLISTRSHTPPGNALEQLILQIWQKYLPEREIGVTDNFFDLGGHSLLIIQIQSALQAALENSQRASLQMNGERSVTVTVVDLFHYPTIRALASYLKTDGGGSELAARMEDQRRAEQRKELRRQYSQQRTERTR